LTDAYQLPHELSADVLLGSCMAGQLSVFTGGSAGLPMGSCVNSGLYFYLVGKAVEYM